MDFLGVDKRRRCDMALNKIDYSLLFCKDREQPLLFYSLFTSFNKFELNDNDSILYAFHVKRKPKLRLLREFIYKNIPKVEYYGTKR